MLYSNGKERKIKVKKHVGDPWWISTVQALFFGKCQGFHRKTAVCLAQGIHAEVPPGEHQA